MVTVISIMGLPSCSGGPQQIPVDELEEIITDAMITSAIMMNKKINTQDTLDPYKSILMTRGYTMEDYVYTIEEMAGRKSNPLAELFKHISERMTIVAHEADFDYKRKLKYDSAVIDFTKKTLLEIDTTIVGGLGEYHFVINNPEIGDYELQFTYRSMGSYDYGTKLVKVEQHNNSVTRNKIRSTSYWMDITTKPKDYTKKFTIDNKNIDSIDFKFIEPKRTKKVRYNRDTSYVKDIRVVFYPPIQKARIEYFEAKTNFPLEIKPYKIDHDFIAKQPLDSIDSIAR